MGEWPGGCQSGPALSRPAPKTRWRQASWCAACSLTVDQQNSSRIGRKKSTVTSSPYSVGYSEAKGKQASGQNPASKHMCPRGLGQTKTIIVPQRDVLSFRTSSLLFSTFWERGSINCVCQYYTLQTLQWLSHLPFPLRENKDNLWFFFSSS